ncbi:MAG: methionine--tRNA ligase [Candidatus Micrarchaeaceae archaeon]
MESKRQKIIVTSALPYAHALPHLGNFVGSILPADAYYKYLMMEHEDAIFICGSDQHGTPIELQAIKEGKSPESLANSVHESIKELIMEYGCTPTIYGKTHTPQNMETVYEIYHALKKNGYIIAVEDKQAYCEVDKRFLVDRDIEGTCPYCGGNKARGDQCDDCGRLLDPTLLINPHCNICGKSEISFREVRNLAIALDKLQDKIEAFVKSSESNGWTKNAINKTLTFLAEGLKPRDITRNMKWGFPVPGKGFEDSVFYVWFDAVIGYIGITREWSATKWKDYWMSKGTKLVQFMGKDNLEFHTMMFPGILIGSDLGYILPYTIRASEYLNSKSVKFSKSRGVGLNMRTALGILGAEYWRFILMYSYPENSDTEFSLKIVKEAVNSAMNDKIGNFVHRVLTLAYSNAKSLHGLRAYTDSKSAEIVSEYRQNFSKQRIKEALGNLLSMATYGNELMSSMQPWNMIKSGNAADAAKTISQLLGVVRCIGVLLYPFCPRSSNAILKVFGAEPDFASLDKESAPNITEQPLPLFSKFGKDEEEKLSAFS